MDRRNGTDFVAMDTGGAAHSSERAAWSEPGPDRRPPSNDTFAKAAPNIVQEHLHQALLRVPAFAARRADAGVRYCAKPASWRRARGAVTFCFDGAPRSAWITGGAILAQHDVRGVYYLSQDYGPGGANASYDQQDVAAILGAGHEIGSMPAADENAAGTTAVRFQRSVQANLEYVTELTGAPRPTSFAYAPGGASVPAKQLCADQFTTARSALVGCNANDVDGAQLHAVGLESRALNQLNIAHFVQTAARTRAWLCVYTRDVSDTPSPLGCTPAALDHAVRLARAAGLDALTAADAATEGLTFVPR